jgi:hypothetical protein
LVSAGAWLALGCGSEKSETKPGAAPAAPAAQQPAPSAAVEQAWQTALPESFPQDVPRYPGSEVVRARTTEDSAVIADFATADEAGKVVTYYADAFAAQGWATQRVDGPDGVLLFADKDQRSAALSVTSAEGKTKVNLLLSEMP